jgi:LytS/YehU family sensor histidine kinase
MNKFENLAENKIVQNIVVWLFLYLIFITSVQAENRFLTAFYIILFLSPVVYVTNLVILPFLKKSKILFFGLFFISTILFTVILFLTINYVTKDDFEIMKLINFFGLMLLTTIFSLSIKLARDSIVKKQKDKEAELQLLKAQLNPHFLFNTLNNLYGLSVLKSDKLPNLMLKLSDLLRYSLYDTKEKLVPLEKEIKYLENYISLEKIRLEDKTNIQFTKTGIINNQKIAPMLLIVFVENAFKHLNKEGKSNVTIIIESTEKLLKFSCKNTFDKTEVGKKQLETHKSGIGLQNAKKRLELIYTNNHKLAISNTEELYLVELELNYTA